MSYSSRGRIKKSFFHFLPRGNWTEVAKYIIEATVIRSKVSFVSNFKDREKREGKGNGGGV